MVPYKKLLPNPTFIFKPETLGYKKQLILLIKTLFPLSETTLKIVFYDHFLNFIRFLSFVIIEKNKLWPEFSTGHAESRKELDGHIFRSFANMLFHFGVIEKTETGFVFSARYKDFSVTEKAVLEQFPNFTNVERAMFCQNFNKLLESYLFIRQLIKLQDNKDTNLNHNANWNKLIKKGKLSYELRLAETFMELHRMSFVHKIKSPFADSYFTVSGEQAFHLYTKNYFTACLQHIANEMPDDLPFEAILDVGCGMGKHISAIKNTFTHLSVTGLELQNDICQKVIANWETDDLVNIFNQNILDFDPHTKFDIILLNYVLFYFDEPHKRQLFRKLDYLLQPGGSLLICQYFPSIEPLKHQLAKLNKDFSLASQIEMYYSDKILYTNALWNDILDTFSHSEQWNELEAILNECGFEIIALSPADKFYYSLFLQIQRKKAPK